MTGIPISLGRLLGPDLVAQKLDDLGIRTDEDQARLDDLTGETRVLGEKPDPGMDRVAAAEHGRR